MPMPQTHAADDLAGCRLGIQDTPGSDSAHHAGYTDDAELFVHVHLGRTPLNAYYVACVPGLSKLAVRSSSMRSKPPCRIASPIETASDASRLLMSLPSAQHDVGSHRASER